ASSAQPCAPRRKPARRFRRGCGNGFGRLRGGGNSGGDGNRPLRYRRREIDPRLEQTIEVARVEIARPKRRVVENSPEQGDVGLDSADVIFAEGAEHALN